MSPKKCQEAEVHEEGARQISGNSGTQESTDSVCEMGGMDLVTAVVSFGGCNEAALSQGEGSERQQAGPVNRGYDDVLAGVVDVLEAARRTSIRAVNACMTAAYWEIGRRIVELEQRGAERANYGEGLIVRLADDLTRRFGRGFSRRNLEQMRLFYRAWPIAQTPSAQSPEIFQTPSGKSLETTGTGILQTSSEDSDFTLPSLAKRLPLPWSH